jgi:hypothetical protein
VRAGYMAVTNRLTVTSRHSHGASADDRAIAGKLGKQFHPLNGGVAQ